MVERSPGGIFFPNDEVFAMLRSANTAGACTEPEPFPDGVLVNAGWASMYFVTDPTSFQAELHDALVLVSSVAIERSAQLVPLLESVAEVARPIVVIAPSLSEEALGLLVVNKLRGVLSANAIVLSDADSLAADLECKAHAALEHVTRADLGKTTRAVSGATTSVIAWSADRL